jgi:GAF domain-containing protein
VTLIRDRFGYRHVSMYFLDDSGEFAILQESTGEAGRRLMSGSHRIRLGEDTLIGWVSRHNQSRVASVREAEGFSLQTDVYPEAKAEVAIPLQVAGNMLGVLDVHSTEPEAFGPEELEVLGTLADQLSAAIQNARLAQQSAEAAERALLASRLTGQLSGLLDVEDVLETSADALHRSLGNPDLVIRLNTPGLGAPQDRGDAPSGLEER